MEKNVSVERDSTNTAKWEWFSDDDFPMSQMVFWRCSNCKRLPLRDGYGMAVLSEFCPHCGKPMVKLER